MNYGEIAKTAVKLAANVSVESVKSTLSGRSNLINMDVSSPDLPYKVLVEMNVDTKKGTITLRPDTVLFSFTDQNEVTILRRF